jgi:carboxypeptidase Taq
MASNLWDTFVARMAEIRDLGSVTAVLTWDQETHMPPRGMAARGEQLATLQGILHERTVDAGLGELLATIESNNSLSDIQQVALREFKFDRDRATKVPVDLVKETARAQATALTAWGEARRERNFRSFAPALKRLLDLRRRTADAYGTPEGGERYDALLEGYEKGMRVRRLEPMFAKLRDWLVPAIQKISERPPPCTDFLQGKFDADKQWQFTLELLDAMGFDRNAGRQDRSVHPFTTSFDPDDVRITTRIFDDLPLSSVFSTVHEAGHALYEQGLPVKYRRTVLCAAASMGLHESQSRLWENLVGRSQPFWTAFLPRYRELFPERLGDVSLSAFVAAVNRVERSPIRVEADEVTYNLHIFIRFELELLLLRDELGVDDLVPAWNERYKRYLDLNIADDAQGVLQDIHWAWGEFGYFPTYTIGNIYSAALFDAALGAIPNLEASIEQRTLGPLRDWLRTHVHQWGRTYEAEQIVQRVTGKGLDVGPYVAYLTRKYESLYEVRL